MLFTVYFSLEGAPKTGLIPKIDIWEITEDVPPTKSEEVTAGVMTEIGDGFYSYPHTADNTKTYTALADADDGTMLGSEKYAPCISTVQGEVLDTKDVVESGTFGNAAIKTETAAILSDTNAIKVDTESIEPKVDLIQTDTTAIIADLDNGTDGLGAIKTDTANILVDTAAIDWTDIDFIKAIEGGRWEIVGNTMTFYDSDNITSIASFALTGTSPDFTQRTRNP